MAKKAEAAATADNVVTAPPVDLGAEKRAPVGVPKKYELRPENCYPLSYVEVHHPLRFGQETRNSLNLESTASIKNQKIFWDFVNNVVVIVIPGKPQMWVVGFANIRYMHPLL